MSWGFWAGVAGIAAVLAAAFFAGTQWDEHKISSIQTADQQSLNKAVSDTIAVQQAICTKQQVKNDAIVTDYEKQISALNAARLADQRLPIKCIPVTVYRTAACDTPAAGVSNTVLQPTISNADLDNAGFAGLQCVAHVQALISATTP